jgi:putative transposase
MRGRDRVRQIALDPVRDLDLSAALRKAIRAQRRTGRTTWRKIHRRDAGAPSAIGARDLLERRTGCPWRYLPSHFPPWQTVYYHFRQFCRTGLWTHLWRELRAAERRRVGRDPHPSAGILDAQSVKTVEESAVISGHDGQKGHKGRKRHLLVDTLGLPIAIYVTPADLSDPAGARKLLAGLAPLVPRLKKIWADAA